MLGRSALALAAWAGAACASRQSPFEEASTTPQASEGSDARDARINMELISADELSALTVSNAYDAVQQLRPLWLHSRGIRSGRALTTEIIVAQNGRYFGPVTALKQFHREVVKELRYMDGAQAGAFLTGLGSRHVEAAIIVVLR